MNLGSRPLGQWQKSSLSTENDNCLELLAPCEGLVKMRESEDPAVVLTASHARLRALLRRVKANDLH